MATSVLTPTRARRRRAPRWPLVAALVLLLAVAAGAGVYLARAHAYARETLPGTRFLGADLGGRDRATAAARIDALLGPRLAQPVNVLAAGHTIALVPGLVLRADVPATTRAALDAGRGSLLARARTLLSPAAPAHAVDPVLDVRPAGLRALRRKLDRWARPPRSASVVLHGTRPVVRAERFGTRADVGALLAALRVHVATGHSTMHVAYVRAAPAIRNAAAAEAAADARTMLRGPIVVYAHDRTLARLAPWKLAGLVTFRPAGARYVTGFDRTKLTAVLRPLVKEWRKPARDASFAVSGTSVSVIPSTPGYDLNDLEALGAVTAAAYSTNDRSAKLNLRTIPAALTTAQAHALGITRELVSFTTQMGTSSSNRIHNVHLMADFIDGTVIRPGEVFSFNDVVGPRTAERGFLEGQMIVGSLVLPAIGGGVCQTATTLFNDAFETGLPILERTNHNLYLSHYPMGRDATVSWGGPDLKFRNDLAHGILIKTSYTDSTLTFTFYGTPQGRRVVSTTSPQTNFRSPTMNYAVDPSAPAGSVHVVAGSGEQGFDVTVSRTVYEHGRVLRRDSFPSHYIADSPTTVYGPGRTPPGPYIVIPPH